MKPQILRLFIPHILNVNVHMILIEYYIYYSFLNIEIDNLDLKLVEMISIYPEIA